MSQFINYPSLGNIKPFETITEKLKTFKETFYDSLNTKNYCLTNIFKEFDENKIIHIESDNYVMDKEKKENTIINSFNYSNEEKYLNNNYEQKNENECEIFNNLIEKPSLNENDEELSKSFLDFKYNFNNDINEININNNSLDINNNEKENFENNSYSFLGKKRYICKYSHENEFKIFHKGQYDEYSRYLIDKVFNKKNQKKNLFKISNKPKEKRNIF